MLLTHDVDAPVNERSAALETNPLRKLSAIRRWRVERREEIAAYRSFSEDPHADRARQGGCGGTARRSRTVSMCSPSEWTWTSSRLRVRRETAAKCCFWVTWARRSIVTRSSISFGMSIRRLRGVEDLRVTVVGGKLPGNLRFFESEPGVEVVGSVDDVRPFLHRASCLVIPLRFGGGHPDPRPGGDVGGDPRRVHPGGHRRACPSSPGRTSSSPRPPMSWPRPSGGSSAIQASGGAFGLRGAEGRARYASDVQARRAAELVRVCSAP